MPGIDTSMYSMLGQPFGGGQQGGGQQGGGLEGLFGQMGGGGQQQQNPLNLLLQRLFGNGTGIPIQQLMALLRMGQRQSFAPAAAQPQPVESNPLLAGIVQPRLRPATPASSAAPTNIAY